MNDVKRTGTKLVGLAIVLVLLLFVIKNPDTAGTAGRDIWTGLNTAAESLGSFVQRLSH